MRFRRGPAAVRASVRRTLGWPLAEKPGRSAGRPGESREARPSQKTCRSPNDDASRGRRTRWREFASITWSPRLSCGPRSASEPPRPQTPPRRCTSRCGSKARPPPSPSRIRCRSPAPSPATRSRRPRLWGRCSPPAASITSRSACSGSTAAGSSSTRSPGVPGDATHFWAFKVGHTLSSIGAGSIKATPGLSVLFYYTTFDPNTGATEPTLGLDGPQGRHEGRGGDVHRHLVERRRPRHGGRRRLGERRRHRRSGRLHGPSHRPVHAHRHLPGPGDARRHDPLAHIWVHVLSPASS